MLDEWCSFPSWLVVGNWSGWPNDRRTDRRQEAGPEHLKGMVVWLTTIWAFKNSIWKSGRWRGTFFIMFPYICIYIYILGTIIPTDSYYSSERLKAAGIYRWMFSSCMRIFLLLSITTIITIIITLTYYYYYLFANVCHILDMRPSNLENPTSVIQPRSDRIGLPRNWWNRPPGVPCSSMGVNPKWWGYIQIIQVRPFQDWSQLKPMVFGVITILGHLQVGENCDWLDYLWFREAVMICHQNMCGSSHAARDVCQTAIVCGHNLNFCLSWYVLLRTTFESPANHPESGHSPIYGGKNKSRCHI